MRSLGVACIAFVASAVACVDPAPTPQTPTSTSEQKPSDAEQVAVESKRVDVEGYDASIRIPAGWTYRRFPRALGAQSPSKLTGFVMFGAQDVDEMKALLSKLRDWMHLEAHEPDENADDDVTIHGHSFVRVRYPNATMSGAPALAVVYVTQLPPRLVAIVTYEVAPEPEDERAALQSAVGSVDVE